MSETTITAIDELTGREKQVMSDNITGAAVGELFDKNETTNVFDLRDLEFSEQLVTRVGLEIGTEPKQLELVASGSLSVANDVLVTLHSEALPDDDYDYFPFMGFDSATPPMIPLNIGYYGFYGLDVGFTQFGMEWQDDGSFDVRVGFDQGGMSGALTVNWQLFRKKRT